MTGKVFNGNPAAFLILILPLAAGIVLLYKAWLWLLAIAGLTILWKAWENYQWQQWCFELNPIFNQLLQENQGCLTPMDLSLKANLTARSARRFLAKKSEEYGAYCKELPDQGIVYYFITASTLGSIFDDSEPSVEEPEEDELLSDEPELISKILETKSETTPSSAVSAFAQLAELKEERQKTSQTTPDTPPIAVTSETDTETTPDNSLSEPLRETFFDSSTDKQPETTEETISESSLIQEETPKSNSKLSLIQVDLAKRLDTTPSTIGRRKSDPSFPEWSQSKDPEGIAWKYLRKSKVFVPVDTN